MEQMKQKICEKIRHLCRTGARRCQFWYGRRRKIATVLFGIAGVGDEHLQLVQQIALYCSDMDNVVQLADALSKEEVTENLAIA